MTVIIKGSTTPSVGVENGLSCQYVSFVEELHKSVPHPDEFSDAETMHDELIRIYDSLHKFMEERKGAIQ